MNLSPFFCLVVIAIGINSAAADAIFSGPQPGEKTTPFKVLDLGSRGDGKERDPIVENAGAPTALIFLHEVERSLLPLLRVMDQYGFERTNQLKTEVIFLFTDRLAGEQRVKTVNGSLKLKSRVSLSLDGLEGPGNYGLNKECMMTVIVARDNLVTASFALVQPGIADAPKIIAALAKVCGDTNPPSIEKLASDAQGERPAMQRDRAGMAPDRAMAPARAPNTNQVKGPFPGAVPTDPRLESLLRQFIRPENEDARVDTLLTEVKSYIKDNAALTKQALDGWTRVRYFGTNYGTAYSQKVGQEFLDQLKAAAPKP